MNARPEIMEGIPNRRHFVKGINPKKWTDRLIACLPDCRHIEKGKVPEKQTYKKGKKSLKVDNGEGSKKRKVDIWMFPGPKTQEEREKKDRHCQGTGLKTGMWRNGWKNAR